MKAMGRMTRNERIAVLERRAAHLAARIARDPRDLSYDKRELAALNWAVGALRRSETPATRGSSVSDDDLRDMLERALEPVLPVDAMPGSAGTVVEMMVDAYRFMYGRSTGTRPAGILSVPTTEGRRG